MQFHCRSFSSHIGALALSIIFLLAPFYSYAQRDSTVKDYWRQEFRSYFKDTKQIVISPARWKKKEYLQLGGVLVLTGSCFLLDKEVKSFSQRNQSHAGENIARYGLEPVGRGLYTFPLLAGFVTYGMVKNKTYETAVGLGGVKAAIMSGVITQVLKYSFHRHRPYQTDDDFNSSGRAVSPFRFDGPFPLFSKKVSFPSGHTTMAFSVASVIAHSYSHKKAIPIICYSLAALAGASRIYDNKHWLSDVVMGAAIGWATGKFVYNKNIKVLPYKSGEISGLSLVHRF